MYESPIKVFRTNTELQKLEDEVVFQAVRNLGFLIDKDELFRALLYDRDQYDKGYRDARESLMSNGVTVQKWIPASEPPKEYRDEYGELIPFLVYDTGADYPFRGVYDGKTWGDGLISIFPTHWMPLPEPPKEDEG